MTRATHSRPPGGGRGSRGATAARPGWGSPSPCILRVPGRPLPRPPPPPSPPSPPPRPRPTAAVPRHPPTDARRRSPRGRETATLRYQHHQRRRQCWRPARGRRGRDIATITLPLAAPAVAATTTTTTTTTTTIAVTIAGLVPPPLPGLATIATTTDTRATRVTTTSAAPTAARGRTNTTVGGSFTSRCWWCDGGGGHGWRMRIRGPQSRAPLAKRDSADNSIVAGGRRMDGSIVGEGPGGRGSEKCGLPKAVAGANLPFTLRLFSTAPRSLSPSLSHSINERTRGSHKR
jgi:hypothetical protein